MKVLTYKVSPITGVYVILLIILNFIIITSGRPYNPTATIITKIVI